MRVNGCSKPTGAMKVIITRWCVSAGIFLLDQTRVECLPEDRSLGAVTLGRK